MGCRTGRKGGRMRGVRLLVGKEVVVGNCVVVGRERRERRGERERGIGEMMI